MASPKKYFHDHLVLLLLSILAFLAIGSSLFMLIRLGGEHSSTYIVQCRDCSNPQAVNKFTNGGIFDLLSFVGFAAIVLASHTILSLRAYRIHRQVAIATLGLGILLMILAVTISNALLVLR